MADAPWFEIVRAWTATVDEIAPGALEGLYVVGSAALDDWQPHASDIDIVAVTAEPADEDMAGTLRAAHAVFVERRPDVAVDGPFLAWGDLVVGPQGVTRPWTLDGSFHHDAECFEINPVTWYTLASYGIRIRGPHVADIPIPIEAEQRVRFVIDNALSYWTNVHAELHGAVGESGSTDTVPSSVPVWCLLGLCRMLYTATTADVTSKSGAGRWAAEMLGDEHRAVCAEVVAMRRQAVFPVGRDVLAATDAAMTEALRLIRIMAASL